MDPADQYSFLCSSRKAEGPHLGKMFFPYPLGHGSFERYFIGAGHSPFLNDSHEWTRLVQGLTRLPCQTDKPNATRNGANIEVSQHRTSSIHFPCFFGISSWSREVDQPPSSAIAMISRSPGQRRFCCRRAAK